MRIFRSFYRDGGVMVLVALFAMGTAIAGAWQRPSIDGAWGESATGLCLIRSRNFFSQILIHSVPVLGNASDQ